MIKRQVLPTLRERMTRYPAVALVGPRQAGKTTLAKSLKGAYFDLEQPSERLRLDLEWDRRVTGSELLILDEAHSWPDVFPRLRGAIDRGRKRNGRFLLLGSVSPALMVEVSESLAGRLSLVELTPLLFPELASPAQRRRHWRCGGYPDGGVLAPKPYPQWQSDYLALLTQRDLPTWGLPARPQTTMRMLRMLAAVHAQTWNASQLGQSLGLSYPTVNSYLDYLTGAFIVRRLPAYQANLRKRLVKSPKVYWRDSGLLHSIMNVRDDRALLAQPWVGWSWEGYVIEQILGVLNAKGAHHDAYYFRTSDGFEIDLLLDFGQDVWAVEIKLTAHPGPSDMEALRRTAALVGASRSVLVSQTRDVVTSHRLVSCDLPWLLEHLEG